SYLCRFGNYFSTGPVASSSWIRETNTTRVLPNLNNPHNGNLALWPGMGTSNGNLIQGLAISTVGYNWCVVASTLQTNQEGGVPFKASPGDRVTYDYEYNDATARYDQTVSVNGKVISTLSTTSDHAQGWGTAVECQQAACGTVPQHQYIDSILTLDVADPNYSKTLALNDASGSLTTADAGITWIVADITVQQFTFT
ncbi:hypothetical protein EV356DRAFT_452941, partial [Viridothelium virens]